jgi:hypothetical protein
MASAPSASDSRWYPDTGSNVHLTNKLSNLNMHAKDYTGIDQIRVGNVQGLHILHFGRGIYLHLHIIFIYCHSYMPLKSRKTLYLSTNSLVITTFSLNFIHIFSVLRTSKPFSLYLWPSSHASSSKSLVAFIGEKVSLDQWHLQLGHPASPIVSQVIKSNKLPVASSKFSSICSPCQQGKSYRFHFSSTPSISGNPLQLLFLDV